MITSCRLSNFRGVLQGRIEGLTRLVVLVGPNGCGKSTILEALDIAASPTPGPAVWRAVSRRRTSQSAHRWLMWRGQSSAHVDVTATTGAQRTLDLEIGDEFCHVRVATTLQNQRSDDEGHVHFHGGTSYESRFNRTLPSWFGVPYFRLVDVTQLPVPLHEVYSRAVREGHRQLAHQVVSTLLSGVEAVEILTEDEEPVLHVVFREHSVPARLAGDGVYAALRIALELVGRPESVYALEEPETHQHPAAITRTAKAIANAVRQTMQVVLTTHSLELIDALVAEANDDAALLDQLTVLRLALVDGQLRTSAVRGKDVLLAREDIDSDLR